MAVDCRMLHGSASFAHLARLKATGETMTSVLLRNSSGRDNEECNGDGLRVGRWGNRGFAGRQGGEVAKTSRRCGIWSDGVRRSDIPMPFAGRATRDGQQSLEHGLTWTNSSASTECSLIRQPFRLWHWCSCPLGSASSLTVQVQRKVISSSGTMDRRDLIADSPSQVSPLPHVYCS